jgi:ABC-type multidrug transport system fused ATPase/permease subunit
MSQPMSFHNKNTSSELAAQVTRDSMGYVMLWTKDIPEMTATVITAIIALYMIFKINIIIGISQLFFIPLILLPAHIFGPTVQKNSERMFIQISKIRSLIYEAFQGVKYIKLMGIKNKLLDKYKILFLGVSKLFGKTAAIETFMGPIVSQVMSFIFLGLGFILGAIFITRNELSIGELMAFIVLAPRVHNSLTNILQTNIQYFRQMGEYRHLFEYMQMNDEYEGERIPDVFLKKNIGCIDMSFSYEQNEKNIFESFSFMLTKGKWLGIQGHSGIGKSTLLDLLLLLYSPNSGKIVMDEMDCVDINREWYRSNIAVVCQDPFLFLGSIRENLLLANPTLDEASMWNILCDVKLDDLVLNSPDHLDMSIGEDGTMISGGEKQRLAIAIALCSKKPLLILDEATSNLDLTTEEHIIKLIKSKVVDEGLTVISITHRSAFHKEADDLLSIGFI